MHTFLVDTYVNRLAY